MSETTRREFLKDAALVGAAVGTGTLAEGNLFAATAQARTTGAATAAPQTVSLSWLGGEAPLVGGGVSLGVPWPQGAVTRASTFSLNAQGKDLPVQSWPLAFWPDGSIKWSGFATVVSAGLAGPLTLSTGAAGAGLGILKVTNNAKSMVVDTGALQCSIPLAGGANLVESMTVEGRAVAGVGQLVCILQTGPAGNPAEVRPREKFVSLVKKATVEQSGPVRAVVKFEGMHRGAASGREWLPFHVRLYFYAGETQVRMVHTIFFDGDQQKDFIHGLGITFAVPMREEIQNRHVRFSGEGEGLWSEPIQPLIGRAGPQRIVTDANGNDAYPAQLAGLRVPNRAQMNRQGLNMVDNWAVWDDFKLVQLNPGGFTIQKRTNPQSTWLFSAAGKRSSGMAFVGDVSGGLGVSVKNFWQSYPAELQVENASSAAAQLTAWLWSPEAVPMDLRHYDTRAHGLEASYEDVQPGNSTPFGIARTSELTLWPSGAVPAKPASAAMAKTGGASPRLVASPRYYHSVRAFGLWSVRDTSTPFKAAIEEGLDATLNLYVGQVDQRNWYGFWNYGDVVHSFDRERHVWRYDLGGMAWDNSELGTDTWLWYSFLRTGRADIFRMAEAMTRHTGEVDSYHFGPMAGLGTRHGVSHWGDGAKEARIGQAAFRRYYYYLTTDERTGDVMREALQAEKSIIAYDPMREADPPRPGDEKFVARVRSGPDWLAIAGNWMTEWERTGNTQWRDKILAGMQSIEAMPHGFRTGKSLLMGFDPATGVLTARDTTLGKYNLSTIMGGAELMAELNLSIDDPKWKRVWTDFCADSGEVISLGKMQAYAYSVTKDAALARSAVASLRAGHGTRGGHVDPPNALAPMDDGTDTNGSSQNSLNAIAVLELCADVLPTAAPTGGGGAGTPPSGDGGA
ncbi:MAG TPA: twin-arginine translocation signal domain-containing protein [Acidobacteriaceae bacterium]|nr:twin-arginine translocation signal domain-containing protein [Acidobacteriaceae bacterium]